MGLFDSVRQIFTITGNEYRCHYCGRTFSYSVELPDLNCPYCDSADIERID
ncbi:hypothetical protein [Haladaptatus pallidirubidus]|uniref:hypothetical protein n=1 Tax=Haladaptatus pallidirubidus TaxID=1008152 RepID=UPI001D12C5F2|nr:hypothetical protein [Haladaptatus pallidirubidus]